MRGPAPLMPVHFSLLKRGRGSPRNMDRMSIPSEVSESITSVVLSIFTDASNANLSLQEALLAVYLSGLQHGQAVATEGKAA